jgi:hypothetical protein
MPKNELSAEVMSAVTAMRFKTGASTHPSDLKLNCGGWIFPIRA